MKTLQNDFQSVVSYNQDLILHLEVFNAKFNVEWQKILSEPFQQVKNINDFNIQQQKCKEKFKNFEQQVQIILKEQQIIHLDQAFKEIMNQT